MGNSYHRARAIVPGKLASCSGYDDVLTFSIIHVVFRHHVVLHSSIIGPTLPIWQCQYGSLSRQPRDLIFPAGPLDTRLHASYT